MYNATRLEKSFIMNLVRTRIAPSPTGFPHIGTIYQVIFDYVFAHKYNGQFVLRIEDTDRARFVKEAEDVIYSSLQWFGLNPDESPVKGGEYGPYRQSERLEIYQKYVRELIEKGHAYYCFCTKERLEDMRKQQEQNKQMPKYDRHCRFLEKDDVEDKLKQNVSHVVRMKIPDNKKIIFDDLIVGRIEFDSDGVDDQVILKSDGFPTYHLGVVVDDHLMKISHVFRGKEWISSTPKHVLLYEYFGWDMPLHGHLPLILNSDGKGKLSKRHGHASVDYYRTEGYLPEAVLNYLINIVWNHPDDNEIFSLEEFMQLFHVGQVNDNDDFRKLGSRGGRFDLQKLNWMNQQYIQKMDDDELLGKIIAFYPDSDLDKEIIRKLLPLLKTRMETLKDFETLTAFFFQVPPIKIRNDKDREVVIDLIQVLESAPTWTEQDIFLAFKTVLEKHSLRMPVLYYLLTGNEKGLPLPQVIEILGREETLKRLKAL